LNPRVLAMRLRNPTFHPTYLTDFT
jgi:hypothetical protein